MNIARGSGASRYDLVSKEWEEKAVGGNAGYIRERAADYYEFIDKTPCGRDGPQCLRRVKCRQACRRPRVRFQGQCLDDETGLHYNRYRYYDPDTARYLTQDPIGLTGGDNFYQYAPNSTIWLDPLGLAKYAVIGEGQSSVEAYAAAMKKKRPCDEFRTTGKEWPGLMAQSGADKFPRGSVGWESQALKANSDWIVDRNREGYSFIDIGEDGAPKKSAFYAIEKQTLHQIGEKVYKSARQQSTGLEITRNQALDRKVKYCAHYEQNYYHHSSRRL